jgi:hypothetical protein
MKTKMKGGAGGTNLRIEGCGDAFVADDRVRFQEGSVS